MSRLSWMMMGLAAIALVAMVAPGTALADEDEKEIPVEDLPEVVVTVVKAVCPGGEIISAEIETEIEKDGRVEIEYEVKVKMPDGKILEVEIEMNEDGKVKKIEVEEDDDD